MQDIKGTLFKLTKNVTKTSGDLFKTTKLGMNLSTEETNLKNLYMDIGKKVHEIYQYGGTLGKFFDEKYLELEACERKIEEIKAQISVIKGTKTCPKCGKALERTAEFCHKCGIRVELAGIETPEPEVSPEVLPEVLPNLLPDVLPEVSPEPIANTKPALKTCRICSTQNESTAKFCLSCGRILD